MQKTNPRLTIRQEELLAKCFDGEGRLLDRWRMRRLLSINGRAAEYMRSLEGSRAVIRRAPGAPVDLWDRVARRIDEEQKREFLLGRRVLSAGGISRSWRAIFDPSNLRLESWGMPLTAVAASLLGIVVYFERGADSASINASSARLSSITSNPLASSSLAKGPAVVPGGGVPGAVLAAEHLAPPRLPVPQVNLVSNGANSGAFSPGFGFDEKGVELEWIRSDGRVRMIQNPQGRSSIIWIRRRAPLQARTQVAGNRPLIIEENMSRNVSALNVK